MEKAKEMAKITEAIVDLADRDVPTALGLSVLIQQALIMTSDQRTIDDIKEYNKKQNGNKTRKD